MRWLQRFRMAMLMLFQREMQTARLNDELAFHLEQQIKEIVARGLAPEEARNAALRAAFLAVEEGSSLTQDHIERAIRMEFREIGKLAETGALE